MFACFHVRTLMKNHLIANYNCFHNIVFGWFSYAILSNKTSNLTKLFSSYKTCLLQLQGDKFYHEENISSQCHSWLYPSCLTTHEYPDETNKIISYVSGLIFLNLSIIWTFEKLMLLYCPFLNHTMLIYYYPTNQSLEVILLSHTAKQFAIFSLMFTRASRKYFHQTSSWGPSFPFSAKITRTQPLWNVF